MFTLRYIAAELRRRKGRTALTALGLAVGVGLVVTVAALSRGLDDAQAEVLEPLTGVGTDMSVSRPILVEQEDGEQSFSAGGPGAEMALSESEQRQLQRENGAPRIGLENRGKPGERFHEQNFMSTDLSFRESEADRVAATEDVDEVAGSLTLDSVTVSGKVPKRTASDGPGGAVVVGGPPDSINFEQSTVSGVDAASPELALVSPDQINAGRYLRADEKDVAIVSQAYADENGIELGDRVKVGKGRFKVIGLSSAPLGATSSDVYVPLSQLQELSDREGRVNALQVRADSSDRVASVATAIEASFPGAEVTTAQDVADRVSGALVDAKELSGTLGTALSIVALVGAILIASLLTLSSVTKRTRELGTLKAIGWRRRMVVRQIAGESLTSGVLGGLAGAALGLGGAALVSSLGIGLDATVAAEQQGMLVGPRGSDPVSETVRTVTLSAPFDVGLALAAIGLACLAGLIAGSAGAVRAARLQPAEALRSVE